MKHLKKQLFTAVLSCLAVAAMGQTNFRSLTFDEAFTAAAQEGKLVFVDFYTDWCGPCRMMAQKVFPQPQVGDYMNKHFVSLKLNAEKEGKEQAELYKVNAYPTFLILNANREVVYTKVGGGTAENLLAELERFLNPDASPERLKQRYQGGERTPQLLVAYVELLLSERENGHEEAVKQAYSVVDEYFAGLNEVERMAADNMFIYRRFLRSTTTPAAAFISSRLAQVPEEHRKEVTEVVSALYRKRMYAFVMRQMPYDAAAYEALKTEIGEKGLNADGWYNLLFRLNDSYVQGDQAAFLALCEELYPVMDNEQRGMLISNLGTLITTEDKEVRRKAVRFVRNLLPEMTVEQLSRVPYPLMMLERGL